MVMDLFYASAPVTRKRRVHFHAFMAEIHGLVDQWRKGDAAARKARFGHQKGDDPIPPIAGVIAGEARLLCFDEFHVTDIADAMILGRLFEALMARGVVIVATSNRAPDDLYKDGLNRQLFLPFIALLKEKLEVVRVAGAKDFRLDRLKGARVYFSPLDPANEAAFDGLWRALLGDDAETGATVEVLGPQDHPAAGVRRPCAGELRQPLRHQSRGAGLPRPRQAVSTPSSWRMRRSSRRTSATRRPGSCP